MRSFLLSFVLFFALSLFVPSVTEARSSVAGAELLYEWVSDSTYRFYYMLYNACSGNEAPDSVTLCIKNTFDSFNTTIQLQKIIGQLPNGHANGTILGSAIGIPACINEITNCTDPNSTFPGYKEWWYSEQFTLPERGNYWAFSVSLDGRDSNINNLATYGNSWVDATLNNLDFQGKTSPYFSVRPVTYVCNNSLYTVNLGAVDINYDSMSFQLVYPSNANACSDTFGNPHNNDSFSNVIPPGGTSYNLLNNPLQCANTFKMDSSNGRMTFMASGIQSAAVSLLCTFYRAGVLIGHLTRDMNLVSMMCRDERPDINIQLVWGIEDSANSFTVGVGMPLCFTFNWVSSLANDTFNYPTDNHYLTSPNAVTDYHHSGTDSLTGIFVWTPTASEAGPHVVGFGVRDIFCQQYEDNPFRWVYINVIDPSGVTGISAGNGNMGIYPNPSSGMINISGLKALEPTEVIVFDAGGRKYYDGQPDAGGGVNLSGLADGVYFVHVRTKQQSWTGKVVIEK